MNISDYVTQMQATFDEVPFGAVDSLVLSQLSYCRLEFAVQNDRGWMDWLRRGYTIKDFFRNEYFDKIFFDGITDAENLNLMAFVCASRRYRDLIIRDIVGDSDDDREMQFGAMIFQLSSDTDFVAFRGTDGSMMGWKEDFNLSYMNEVPSQSAAVEYIQRNYGRGNFAGRKRKLYIGGHSKGGNLAVYGALMSDPEIHSRILGVYSLDGPGFRDEVQAKLDRVRDANQMPIHKLVPQSSIVGMLMQNDDRYRVVKSDAFGIMQHVAFSWQLTRKEDGVVDFIYVEEIDAGGKYMSRTVREFLQNVDDAHRKVFIDALFDIIQENGINDLTNLKALSLSDIAKMVTSLRNLDDAERTVVTDVLRSLAGAAMPKFPAFGRKEGAEKTEGTDNLNSGAVEEGEDSTK